MAGIRALRTVARCSRKQLAAKAQIGDFRIWLIESGRVVATSSEEVQLRRALYELLKQRSVTFHRMLLEETQA